MNKEIRFTGFGGQGIILAGYITGKAASIFDNLNATLTQSYGPESRGGACSAQLIVADEPIPYPHLTKTDILMAMSQEGYRKYKDELKSGGILLIDEDLVKPESLRKDIKVASIPAMRFAEQLGKRVVANMVMLGFVIGITKAVSQEAIEQVIKTSVPKGTEKLNLKAFQKGWEYAQRDL